MSAFAIAPAEPAIPEAPTCPTCEEPLDLQQPDTQAPGRVVGLCLGCYKIVPVRLAFERGGLRPFWKIIEPETTVAAG